MTQIFYQIIYIKDNRAYLDIHRRRFTVDGTRDEDINKLKSRGQLEEYKHKFGIPKNLNYPEIPKLLEYEIHI